MTRAPAITLELPIVREVRSNITIQTVKAGALCLWIISTLVARPEAAS